MIGKETIKLFGTRVTVDFDEDERGEHCVAWEEANCYGFGSTEASAIQDLKDCAECLYWTLYDEPDEKLSPRQRGWKQAIVVLNLKALADS